MEWKGEQSPLLSAHAGQKQKLWNEIFKNRSLSPCGWMVPILKIGPRCEHVATAWNINAWVSLVTMSMGCDQKGGLFLWNKKTTLSKLWKDKSKSVILTEVLVLFIYTGAFIPTMGSLPWRLFIIILMWCL